MTFASVPIIILLLGRPKVAAVADPAHAMAA